MFSDHSLLGRRLLSAVLLTLLVLTLLAFSPADIFQLGPSGARASQTSADESTDGALGKQASQGRPPAPVEVVPVERARVESRLDATGTLRAPEELMLKSRGRGRVAELRFREGKPVSAGDTLLRLERDRAEAAVREAAATLSQAENAQARLQELSGRDFVSTQEQEQAAATTAQALAALQLAREDLRDRTLIAPFDGVMGERLVSPGELLEPSTPIARLQQLDPLDLALDLPGTVLGQVAHGAEVRATTPAFPDETFRGAVRFITPRVDPDTGTLRLEARFPNPERRLKPGLFMRARLITGRRDLLRVPEQAVVAEGPSEHLFVLQAGAGESTRVARRTVATGLRRDGWVEIRDGVNEGERAVVAGVQSLRDGRAVRVAKPDAPMPAGADQ
ncbi:MULTISPECIES: efflux RND transporter periplasmic adaptor subunit [Thiorhodovibrio]|uniref:efflux RND transporter periplasmic adaptor subunit n=1 Tax=Thiorhodovibrio TaxID=61593 RepID=UPI0019121C4F|nr:efflux RND transporter periplasmic adaptor subunit [Thiorhodovibrio litoralis]WPL13413.1 Solvent efflux pump periplasmic linker SrpA precursor [Thiorhodovibrio litoralis]